MTQSSTSVLAASFRDPAGAVFSLNGRIFRVVTESGLADLSSFLDSRSGQKLIERADVVRTRILGKEEAEALRANPAVEQLYDLTGAHAIVEHERVRFPSYPYEWAPEMFYAVALQTIRIAETLLEDGLGLKDGTPYNVLFQGPKPVFVDMLSFERRDSRDPTWLPYAQFVRTFLLPLLANKHFGLSLDQLLTTRRDGLEPEAFYRLTNPIQRLRPPFLSLVSIPTWLASQHNPNDIAIYKPRLSSDPEKARFILKSLLRRLARTTQRLRPARDKQSVWSAYMDFNNNYAPEHFKAKQRFVDAALAEFAPKDVLDVGCNTGHFSTMAAKSGAAVVAVDYDPVVTGRLWEAAEREGLDILPLVVDLTRPTPGTGWMNRENASFLDRARGRFDFVLMLAVIHHMLVTERVPLNEIFRLASELTRDVALIEFIAPEDSMFRRLTRGRDHLHAALTNEVFESVCRAYFEPVRVTRIEGTSRWLYLLRKVRRG